MDQIQRLLQTLNNSTEQNLYEYLNKVPNFKDKFNLNTIYTPKIIC